MIRPVPSIAVPSAAVLALLAAAGCAPPQTTSSRQDAAALAACRTRTDQVYQKQNRYLMSERDQRDTPYASTGLPSNTAAGLGQRFGYDQMLAGCLNQNGPAAGTSSQPGTAPAMSPSAPGPVTVGPR